MPAFNFKEENFDILNRENYKSRGKKCKKLSMSQTCTKASKNKLDQYNTCAYLTESYLSLPKNLEEILAEKSLLQTYPYAQTNLNRSSQHVYYSMNKKKRWLLPDMIRECTEELYPFKPMKKDSKEKDEEANDLGITAYYIDIKSYRRRGQESYEYFDNNQTHIKNSFNYESLHTQINIPPRRRSTRTATRTSTRTIRGERVLYRKEKPQSKNINIRNSNSWFNAPAIEVNEDETAARNFRDANKIEFKFLMPRKVLKHKKCCQIGSRFSYLCNDVVYRSNFDEREHRRLVKMNKSFSQSDAKKEQSESFNNLNSRVEFIYDSSPILTSMEELMYFDKTKSWRLASVSKKFTSASSACEFTQKKIIQIDESDAICFNSNGLKRASVKNVEENNDMPLEAAVHIKPCGLYKKYKLQISQEFFNSLNENAQITFDTTPTQLLVNLANDNHSSSSYVIINLSSLDSFYLNTNMSVFERLEERCQESQTRVFADISDLKNFLNENLSEEKEEEYSRNFKISSNLKVSNLIGKYSFTDEQSLYKSYSFKLNPELARPKDIFTSLAPSKSNLESKKFCQVCFDELDETKFLKLNKCEHEACIECWREFFRTKIENMKVTVSFSKEKNLNINKICCFYDKCDTNVRLDTIRGVLPIDYANKYVQFYTDLQIIQSNSNLVYCKNQRCNKLIQVVKGESVSVCECGLMICNYCLKENHFPSMCKQAREYFKNIEKLNEIMVEDSSELATSEGKKCPSCDNYMEKNMGCNHMSCPCGTQFCWLCLKPFYEFHLASTGYACTYSPVETLKYDASYFVSIKSVRLKFAAIMRESRQRKTSVKLQHKINEDFNSLAIFCKSQLSKEMRDISSSTSLNHGKMRETLNDLLAKYGFNFKFKELDQETTSLQVEIDEIISSLKSNFLNFNIIIEYLALLLSQRSKKFIISNYSFGTNLYRSLKKAILIYSLESEIIGESEKSLEQLKRVLFYDKIVRDFVTNLKHLTVNFLKIYENQNVDSSIKI